MLNKIEPDDDEEDARARNIHRIVAHRLVKVFLSLSVLFFVYDGEIWHVLVGCCFRFLFILMFFFLSFLTVRTARSFSVYGYKF